MDLNQICPLFSSCPKVCCLMISFVLTTRSYQPFVHGIHCLVVDLIAVECKDGRRGDRQLLVPTEAFRLFRWSNSQCSTQHYHRPFKILKQNTKLNLRNSFTGLLATCFYWYTKDRFCTISTNRSFTRWTIGGGSSWDKGDSLGNSFFKVYTVEIQEAICRGFLGDFIVIVNGHIYVILILAIYFIFIVMINYRK